MQFQKATMGLEMHKVTFLASWTTSFVWKVRSSSVDSHFKTIKGRSKVRDKLDKLIVMNG